MSNGDQLFTKEAAEAFKERVGRKAAEYVSLPKGEKRPKGKSKLAERTSREADAFHCGDGRRRRAPADTGRVQLNCAVRLEAKEIVRDIAIADDEDMQDTVEKAIYAYQDIWRTKRGKPE